MTWLKLARLLLSLASQVMSYVKTEQLMDAGEARLLRQQMVAINERLDAAERAGLAMAKHNADGGLHDDDGHRRD